MPPPVKFDHRAARPPGTREGGSRRPGRGTAASEAASTSVCFFACSEHGKKKYEIEKAVSPVLHTGAPVPRVQYAVAALLPVALSSLRRTGPGLMRQNQLVVTTTSQLN
jgi:hypothetical protein